MSKEIIDLFSTKTIEWSKYPLVKTLQVNKYRCLLVLYIVKEEFEINELTARNIYDILNGKLMYTISIQAVQVALKSMINIEIDFTMKDGIRNYTLIKEGIKTIKKFLPKEEIDSQKNESIPDDKNLFLPEIFVNSKTNILRVLEQINGCYYNGYFDACFTMIRRIFETLIIEIYDIQERLDEITDANDYFYQLSKLIRIIVQDKKLRLSRNTKDTFSNAKYFGDIAAHNPRINLKKRDIDDYKKEMRIALEELLTIIKNSK